MSEQLDRRPSQQPPSTGRAGTADGSYVGHMVIDQHHERVGTVTDVIYDDHRDIADWLIVDPGILRSERVVPVEGSYVSDEDTIVVPFDKRWVLAADKAPGGHVLTEVEIRHLDAHYGTHRAS
jgi:hypothetical protein